MTNTIENPEGEERLLKRFTFNDFSWFNSSRWLKSLHQKLVFSFSRMMMAEGNATTITNADNRGGRQSTKGEN